MATLGASDTPAQTGQASLRARKRGVPRFLRRAVRRSTVDHALDLLRLHVDTFPRGLYQPVDLPVRAATRADGTLSRWEAIRPVLLELGVGSAVDVGANAGYFAIEIARATGASALAVDHDPAGCRTAALAIRRSGLENVGVMQLELRPDTVGLVPQADATLLLSVWHHLVRHQGLDAAGALLAALWERTGRVLLFDTGEDEMGPDFGLPPMEPSPRAWLEHYLAGTCAGGEVRHLGEHDAFGPDGEPVRRNLFAVVRRG